jgi:hypothetical protein
MSEESPKAQAYAPKIAEQTEERIQRGKKSYTPETLEKKRELAMKALQKAREANAKRAEERKQRSETEPVKTPVPPRNPEPERASLGQSPSEDEPEPKPRRKGKQAEQAAEVVEDSDDSSESDDDAFVLVKKKLVKKYKNLKQTTRAPPRPRESHIKTTHEVSEKALADRWAADRYRLMQSSLFPNYY